MKRLWIGVGLLVLFLVSGTLLTLSFHRIHAPLSQTLDAASGEAMAGNWEKAQSLAQTARDRWEKYRKFTAAVADHAPLEEMDALFAQLEVYSTLCWETEFAAICAQLSSLAAAMEESQAITWWTLL